MWFRSPDHTSETWTQKITGSNQGGQFVRPHHGTDCIVVAPSFYAKRTGTASLTSTRCCKSHRSQTRRRLRNNVATNGSHNYPASHGNAYRQLNPRALIKETISLSQGREELVSAAEPGYTDREMRPRQVRSRRPPKPTLEHNTRTLDRARVGCSSPSYPCQLAVDAATRADATKPISSSLCEHPAPTNPIQLPRGLRPRVG